MGGAAAPRTGDSPAGLSTDYKGGAPLSRVPPCSGPPGPWTKGTSRVGHYGPGGALMGLHEQILGPSDHPETQWVLQRCSVNISPVNKQRANRQLEHQENKQVKH